jgi:hypothetical protein
MAEAMRASLSALQMQTIMKNEPLGATCDEWAPKSDIRRT